MDYTVSDVRLLTAVLTAADHQPATIAEVVAVGRSGLRSAWTADELFGGLRRLIRGGRIRMVGNRYEPTPSFRVSLREVLADDATGFDRVEVLRQMLQVVEPPSARRDAEETQAAEDWERLAHGAHRLQVEAFDGGVDNASDVGG